MTEVTDTDEKHKVLNECNNEISELKSCYLTGQDEEFDDVIENASLVSNNQLNLFNDYVLKDEQITPTKQLSKPRSSSSILSICFPLQKTIAERTKLNPQKRKQEQD